MVKSSVLSEAIIFARSMLEDENIDISKEKLGRLLSLGQDATISSIGLVLILAKKLSENYESTPTQILDDLHYEIIISEMGEAYNENSIDR